MQLAACNLKLAACSLKLEAGFPPEAGSPLAECLQFGKRMRTMRKKNVVNKCGCFYLKNATLRAVEFFNGKTGLLNYGSQSAFGNIFSGMVRDNCSFAGVRVIPNFMASFGMAIKNKTGFTQFTDNFARSQRRDRSHISKGTGIFVLNLIRGAWAEINFFGIGSLCSIRDSIILWATSSAISIVSAIVRPWAISPWRKELVAKYPPSFNGSMDMGIRYSDIFLPRHKNSMKEALSQGGNRGYKFQVASYKLQVSGIKFQGTGFKLQVSSYRDQVTGFKFQRTGIQVTSCRLQGSGFPPEAGPPLAEKLAACGLQLAACNLRLATCGLQLAACNLRLAICGLQLEACNLQPVTCNLQLVA